MNCDSGIWRLNGGNMSVEEEEAGHRDVINNIDGPGGAGGAKHAMTFQKNLKQAEAETQVQPQPQPHQRELTQHKILFSWSGGRSCRFHVCHVESLESKLILK